MSDRRQTVQDHATALAAIVPLVLAVAGAFFVEGGEGYRTKYGLWSWIIAAHWLVILYLLWMVVRGPKINDKLISPAVKAYQKTYGYLLVSQVPWLGIGLAVSVYRLEDGFERYLCVGAVENIQANGLASLRPIATSDGASSAEIAAALDRRDLSDIIVKPGTRSPTL